jgi:anthranilate synthase component 1
MTPSDFQSLLRRERTSPDEAVVVPLDRRVSADLLTPVSAFLKLREGARMPFLLESVEGGERVARYSFLGRDPYAVLTARGSDVDETRDGQATRVPGDLFDVLRARTTAYREIRRPGLPRLTGGAVGFAGYDTVRLIEHLPDAPPDDLHVPTAVWGLYDHLVAFDHVRRQVVLLANAFVEPGSDGSDAFGRAQEALDALEETLRGGAPQPGEALALPSGEVQSNVTREQFTQAVERARRYIYEGDIFQVVLSQRFTLEMTGDPFNAYRALRQVNPSPYLFFLDLGAFQLVGSSPEVLVRCVDGRIELMPIAGTRPRGATPEEDLAHEQSLQADKKERAEHLMLVDLGRNDVGRVAEWGTVEVDDYAFVERYSHVMHIVSSVSGRLRAGLHAVDVLRACFPAGTLSGAPKVRAMEIIDELEPTGRGTYAGAVGYVDFGGNLDTCIAIRTMLVHQGRVHIQAGAGIVADSDPDREFEETVNKAQALRTAVRVASEHLL